MTLFPWLFQTGKPYSQLVWLRTGDILTNQETIMAVLDDLTSQVAANKTVVDSALALIAGIADRIAAAGTDPAKLAALTSDLKSEDDALAEAVAANTPAPAPAPTP